MTGDQEYRWEIQELLHRRTDLSTFVIHWTRQGADGRSARDNLADILTDSTILARSPMGPAVKVLERLRDDNELDGDTVAQALDSQKVVCFTEAPLEQAWSFVCRIAGRRHELEPFGVAFTKAKAREMAVNPVWYTDMTPGHDWLINHVERLVERAADSGGSFVEDPIAKIAPFVDWMGTWEGSKKEFWWEREWRHLGHLEFALEDVAVVLCPASDMEHFESRITSESHRTVPTVDPNWGLERIIAALAGVSIP